MNALGTRALAFEVLRSGSSTPTRKVLTVARRAELDDRDRRFLTQLVRTEVRRRGTLQALLRSFARGKPNRDLSTFLRIGLVQLLFLDGVPDHAALGETVGAAVERLGLSKGPYVNGVLRAAQRALQSGASGDPRRDLVGRDAHFEAPVFRDPATHPFLWAEDALSIPAPLYKGWVKRFGEEEAGALARACLEEPRISLRVVRGEREALRDELAAADVVTISGEHPAILVAEPDQLGALLSSAAFAEGRLTVQGEAALRAAELCGAQEGQRWLDLCAAPGGKTAVLAGKGAEVVACDVEEAKLTRLTETLARLGLAERVETRLLDQESSLEAESFDGVLVDAPCSNTGVLARRPDARWRFGPKSRRALTELQDELLGRGAACVRPGGALVYSTCSIEPAENEQRVRGFLEAQASWTLEEELATFPRPRGPGGSVDGGFAARLRRG